MKAAIRHQYCSYRSIQIADIDMPTPKKNEVLIRVMATTVNRTDCAVVTGKPFIMRFFTGIRKPKKSIIGTDFAGIVHDIGSDVTRYAVGNRVWGFHDEGLSTQAQYICLPQKYVHIMPDFLSYKTAAASIEGVHYARNSLRKVAINDGQYILVNGASGAIGTALVQLLQEHNIHLTAVCHTKNVQLMKNLGATRVIDYTQMDIIDDQQQYDVIFDMIGEFSFKQFKQILSPNGVFMSSELGAWCQFPLLAIWTMFFGSQKVVFPIPSNIPQTIHYSSDKIAKGAFTTIIDREYPISQLHDAYEYVAKGHKTGNVIIDWSSQK